MPHERDDHFIFEAEHNPHVPLGRSLRVTKPSDVLIIDGIEELKLQLHHYARPFLKHVAHDSNFARRWVVEKVRPALRYYCKKYGIEVPAWLKNEDYFVELPDDEKMKLFGRVEIVPREFTKPNVKSKGPVTRKDGA